MKTDDHARSRAQITSHQRVGRGIKRTFPGGYGDNKRAVTRDGDKVNEIEERARFFQGQKAKIRLA